jgi:hypothetical protein
MKTKLFGTTMKNAVLATSMLLPLLCSAQTTVTVPLDVPYTIKSTVAPVGASSFQWMENGADIDGATSETYTADGKPEIGVYHYVRKAYMPACAEWQPTPEFTVVVFQATFDGFSPDPDAPAGTVWYLLDNRAGGNYQTYKVQKAPDGYITMIAPLKYGSCTATARPASTDELIVGEIGDGLYGRCFYANSRAYYDPAAALQLPYFSSAPLTCSTEDACSASAPVQGLCPDGWYLPSGSQGRLSSSSYCGGLNTTSYRVEDGMTENCNCCHGYDTAWYAVWSNIQGTLVRWLPILCVRY